MGTLVTSDLHADPAALDEMLSDAKKRFGRVSRIVVAGDCIGRGPDSVATLKRASELADQLLWGNHEVCEWMGESLGQGGNEAWALVNDLAREGRFCVTTSVAGHLVVHAGLGRRWIERVGADGLAGAALSEFINDLPVGTLAFDMEGPFWYAVRPQTVYRVPQMVGHIELAHIARWKPEALNVGVRFIHSSSDSQAPRAARVLYYHYVTDGGEVKRGDLRRTD